MKKAELIKNGNLNLEPIKVNLIPEPILKLIAGHNLRKNCGAIKATLPSWALTIIKNEYPEAKELI